MGLGTISALLAFGLLGALALGLWVALSLLGVALVAILLMTNVPAGAVTATAAWGASNSWDLTALPMFIWMGEILFRTRLSEDMFAGISPFMRRIPGRLLHVNIVGCAIFAAVSGSSAATTAMIGRMSLPELRGRGYDEKMAIGTLAGSGTLGLLIPPSIILIVYGAATEQSIARLFIAGILPGAMLACLFMGYVVVWSLLRRSGMPEADPSTSMRQKFSAARRLLPVVLLIVGVIGSIYAGLAAPTEAAAIGVMLALLLSWVTGTLTRASFAEALMSATRTSCMIAFILMGAAVLTVAMGFTGIPRELASAIGAMDLSFAALLAALTLLFIVLGCFLDGISVVVLTTSVILPIVEAAGFDLIWFGIYLVLVVEMSQITPPVGFNLFVLQGITGHNIFKVAVMALPFFLIMVVAVALIAAFPEIALFLPRTMLAR
ncbi:TRAP transporter large permease [Afifella marina]|uniref:TRAP transporter large permease protein n=1 Tax=Afifella marina DSM 2698 TaxID=1120955 RepID=A0A1G5N4Z0_AFIMA|nr:TRAP transporter large permease subunit [Afifella marina]MBK1622396.1 C4-dicarboxylate ABC transporter permease [Afifella marina DSM 2698]MBK1626890.1 C4-dicarboxylate ABC transporter permease [Afifella marina]MBK5919180.1 C4-dicarboxylate ABC transporter permease [Afifella marina]RAI21228.1 C4-dicarboxylate ABC transporter permease [Afifella marina DSM 2698]SCZ31861.1 TRAP transporter, DctM subunit [Afifella marina DSM 2698]